MSNSEENVKENAKIRLALRREYIKQMYNPHRHMSGEGGHIFDTGIQRFMTARYCSYPYFKPTPKTTFLGVALFVVPFFAYTLAMQYEREVKEEKYRTGQVAYKDRHPKFI